MVNKKKRSKKAGLPPGSIVYLGEQSGHPVRIQAVRFNKEIFEERTVPSPSECASELRDDAITWLNIAGVSDVDTLKKIGTQFNLHPLTLEDIASTTQRPKIEKYETYLYAVLRVIKRDKDSFLVASEQISLILGKNFVISLEDGEDDFFRYVRSNLEKRGRLREMGSDFLFYTLIDLIVDGYFVFLEEFGEEVEKLELELVRNPVPDTLRKIYGSKRALMAIRRAVWPTRELLSNLERGGSSLIRDTTNLYLRDVYDHIIEIIDMVEAVRDINSGMLDVYLSSISNRMNNIMKVLTIITTIFMPLSFIAGVYGMNFENMPELRSHYGYPVVLVVMLMIGLSMLAFFRRKRWL